MSSNQNTSATSVHCGQAPVWIDLDNTPHIPFFKPIIRELQKRGHNVVVSARDAYQVCEVADRACLEYTRIGRHYGKNPFWKVCGTGWRAIQLLPFFLRYRPALAVSHGSRSQIILSDLVGIPSALILDYEFVKGLPLGNRTTVIAPRVVSEEASLLKNRRTRTYEGLKEDVYVPEFRPDGGIVGQLGLDMRSIVVTIRPPATEAHYHNPQAEALLVALMEWINGLDHVQPILLPRNKRQETEMRKRWPGWFDNPRLVVPQCAVDGLNLLWHSDLVVSGGGTMNREAAALGVPVYSIFRGQIGAIDRRLVNEGRLVLIESVADLRRKLIISQRPKDRGPDHRPRPALSQIIDHIECILGQHRPAAAA